MTSNEWNTNESEAVGNGAAAQPFHPVTDWDSSPEASAAYEAEAVREARSRFAHPSASGGSGGPSWPSAPAAGAWDEPERRPGPELVGTGTGRSRWRAARLSAAALLVGLVVGGAAGGGVAALTSSASSAGSATAAAAKVSAAANTTSRSAIGAIVQRVEPALVDIETQGTSDTSSLWGNGLFGGGQTTTQAAGTGMIINSDGLVLTNFHVISGASTIDVVLDGQTTPHPAKVIGTDPSHDVALIQIEGMSGLPTVTLGNSSTLAVGDSTVAIGNALNLAEGSFSVSQGIVSGLNRSIQTDTASLTGMVQTDAAISSGDSGGPLLNAAGQVIGMDTAAAASSGQNTAQNIGFAISVDTIKSLLPGLEKGGTGGATTSAGSSGSSSQSPGGAGSYGSGGAGTGGFGGFGGF